MRSAAAVPLLLVQGAWGEAGEAGETGRERPGGSTHSKKSDLPSLLGWAVVSYHRPFALSPTPPPPPPAFARFVDASTLPLCADVVAYAHKDDGVWAAIKVRCCLYRTHLLTAVPKSRIRK